jgi:hypothetical protein
LNYLYSIADVARMRCHLGAATKPGTRHHLVLLSILCDGSLSDLPANNMVHRQHDPVGVFADRSPCYLARHLGSAPRYPCLITGQRPPTVRRYVISHRKTPSSRRWRRLATASVNNDVSLPQVLRFPACIEVQKLVGSPFVDASAGEAVVSRIFIRHAGIVQRSTMTDWLTARLPVGPST